MSFFKFHILLIPEEQEGSFVELAQDVKSTDHGPNSPVSTQNRAFHNTLYTFMIIVEGVFNNEGLRLLHALCTVAPIGLYRFRQYCTP